MATIRINKNKDYVVLKNTALNDENLSFKAKGIFAYLMSKPDDWKCQVTDLKNHAKDGTDSIKAGLRELRKYGYMIKRPLKNEKNVIIEWEEILYETPQKEAMKIFEQQEQKRIVSLEKRRNREKATNGKSTSGENFNNSTNGKSINGKSTSGKPNYILNTNILNTNILNTDTSSSSIFQHFNNSICELKKTTTPKFLEYTNKYDEEFIFTIINYCEEVSIKSFAGFKKVIDAYIEKNILTKEEFIKDVEAYRANKKAKKQYTKKSYNKNKVDSFNNYKQRNYDFKKLEKVILGQSDDSLEDCIKREVNYENDDNDNTNYSALDLVKKTGLI